jgi:hypothetical protein
MRLLKESDDAKIGLMAQADDEAVRLGNIQFRYENCIEESREVEDGIKFGLTVPVLPSYMYLEYLEWMSDVSRVLLHDTGEIKCHWYDTCKLCT